MRRLQHLPWLIYLGLCVFLAAVAARRERDSRTLVVDRAALQAARAGDESLRGRPQTPAERESFEAGWLQGRVLLSEARRRGLERGDLLIRSSILGRTILSLAPEVGEPTDAELRRHFADNRADYGQPATLRLSVATFPTGAEMPPEAAVRARLEGGEAPVDVGPSSLVGPRLEGMSRSDLRVLFGGAFSDAVYGARQGVWVGPLASTFGTHFVRIEERHPLREPPFEEVAGVVRQDWVAAQEQRVVTPTLEKLRARYVVTGLDR